MNRGTLWVLPAWSARLMFLTSLENYYKSDIGLVKPELLANGFPMLSEQKHLPRLHENAISCISRCLVSGLSGIFLWGHSQESCSRASQCGKRQEEAIPDFAGVVCFQELADVGSNNTLLPSRHLNPCFSLFYPALPLPSVTMPMADGITFAQKAGKSRKRGVKEMLDPTLAFSPC